jgi:hypothetical protein
MHNQHSWAHTGPVALLCCAAFALAGCGSGGGSGSGTDTAPTVSSVTPADKATGAIPGAAVSVTFSKPMDCGSLTASSFVVLAGATPVDGTVHCSGTHATFTAAGPLLENAAYSATVTKAATDQAGNPLAADYTWSFTTRTRAWSAAQLLETSDAGDATYPQIAFDTDGNALATWQMSDGALNTHVMSSRYAVGSGWETTVDADPGHPAMGQQFAIDGQGDAVAVWQYTTGEIVLSRYTKAAGWGTPQSMATGNVFNPQVAVDASGNALVVWQETPIGKTYQELRSRYCPAGGTCGGVDVVQTSVGGNSADSQRIAFDQNGIATVLWRTSDGTCNRIYARRYTPNIGWDIAETIDPGTGDANSPQLVVDGGGDLLAVWGQTDGTHWNIYANHFSAATTAWGTAELAEADSTGDAGEPQVAVDADGNATVVYRWTDGANWYIHANRYSAGAWGTAGRIDSEAGGTDLPRVAVDGNGVVIAMWLQVNGAAGLRFNRYTTGSGWGTATTPVTVTADQGYLQFALDRRGNAIAVWSEYDGTAWSIFASRFE